MTWIHTGIDMYRTVRTTDIQSFTTSRSSRLVIQYEGIVVSRKLGTIEVIRRRSFDARSQLVFCSIRVCWRLLGIPEFQRIQAKGGEWGIVRIRGFAPMAAA